MKKHNVTAIAFILMGISNLASAQAPIHKGMGISASKDIEGPSAKVERLHAHVNVSIFPFETKGELVVVSEDYVEALIVDALGNSLQKIKLEAGATLLQLQLAPGKYTLQLWHQELPFEIIK